MKQTTLKQAAIAAGVAASALCSISTQAQSADALLDKLVEKGILTTKEANDLKREADQGFTKAYQVKSGMPDWVTSLKLSGDFRARYEGNYYENDDPSTRGFSVQRDRYRYRLRFGAVATLKDNFEVGLRLASGDAASGFSTANPLSASSTFQDNGSRKGIFVDLAYAKWTALNNASANATLTFGKMESPFAFSYNVFDPDYNPEGLAGQFTYNLSSQHSIKAIGGGFVLDEFSLSTHDPLLVGGQLLLDSKWSKQLSSSLGAGILGIKSVQSLTNSVVPNINRGNTRSPGNAGGYPTFHFNPIVGDASLTYTLDSFPCYQGPFPVKLLGEYLNNPATSTKNEAFMGGVVFGKAGKKHTWELSYQYRYLGANSWYEELPDDDFGAFYGAEQPNAGFMNATTNPTGAGFGGGTNVRGHVAKATYSLTDSLAFIVTYYNAILINELPAGSKSGTSHLLVDLVWKF